MDNATPRPIFVSLLVGTLAVYSLSLAWDNRALSRTNQSLLEQSKTLGHTLEKMTGENRFLLTGVEGRKKDELDLRDTVESLKKENESLAFQLKKIETQTSTVREEKSYLEEMLINKTKQIDILKTQGPSSAEGASQTVMSIDENGIRSEIGEKDTELKKLNEQNKVLQDKLDRLFRTTSSTMTEINVAKIALAETVSTAQKKIEDEWNTVNLGAVTTRAMPARQNEVEEAPVPHTPKSEGHVLAINNEHGFVVIDLGKVDNLPQDAVLEVKKDGIPVAKLSVLELRDVMAACNIQEVMDGQRIEINDSVSLIR